MIVDFRRNRSVVGPIVIDKTEVEQIDVFPFLGICITDGLTWHFNKIALKYLGKRGKDFIF